MLQTLNDEVLRTLPIANHLTDLIRHDTTHTIRLGSTIHTTAILVC